MVSNTIDTFDTYSTLLSIFTWVCEYERTCVDRRLSWSNCHYLMLEGFPEQMRMCIRYFKNIFTFKNIKAMEPHKYSEEEVAYILNSVTRLKHYLVFFTFGSPLIYFSLNFVTSVIQCFCIFMNKALHFLSNHTFIFLKSIFRQCSGMQYIRIRIPFSSCGV